MYIHFVIILYIHNLSKYVILDANNVINEMRRKNTTVGKVTKRDEANSIPLTHK
jgi:hypothetical protein